MFSSSCEQRDAAAATAKEERENHTHTPCNLWCHQDKGQLIREKRDQQQWNHSKYMASAADPNNPSRFDITVHLKEITSSSCSTTDYCKGILR